MTNERLPDDEKAQIAHGAEETRNVAPLVELVAYYTAEIDYRRHQLADELQHFEMKLRDLAELDPLDFTGLAKINREHAHHIRGLLAGFDAPGVEFNS
jgi:hypothetical protein